MCFYFLKDTKQSLQFHNTKCLYNDAIFQIFAHKLDSLWLNISLLFLFFAVCS